MEKFDIQISTRSCTGCLRCQLACSDLYFRSFNPSLAKIRVITSDAEWTIELMDDCSYCGICVDHCFYDALRKHRREARP